MINNNNKKKKKKDHRHKAPVSAQGGIIHLVVRRRVREARPTRGKCLPVSGPACCCAARPVSDSPWWLPWCPCAPGGCASPCSTLAATHSDTATCGDEGQSTARFWSNIQQCALWKAIPTKCNLMEKHCVFSLFFLACWNKHGIGCFRVSPLTHLPPHHLPYLP